jgi:hypothetical protein
MKRLAILAAFALVIAMPATAQAQCTYRMKDPRTIISQVGASAVLGVVR